MPHQLADPRATPFDHAVWLAEQIVQMEAWLTEKRQKRFIDPNEIRELENHLNWLRSQLPRPN